MKYCPKCHSTKHESEFHYNKSTSDGLQGYCKECINEMARNRDRSKMKDLKHYITAVCEECGAERLVYKYRKIPKLCHSCNGVRAGKANKGKEAPPKPKKVRVVKPKKVKEEKPPTIQKEEAHPMIRPYTDSEKAMIEEYLQKQHNLQNQDT